MTNYNERLDEILHRVYEQGVVDEHGDIKDGDMVYPNDAMQISEAKQAILRWVSDVIINVPIDYSMSKDGFTNDMGIAEKRLAELQENILKQHGWKEGK